MVELHIDTQNRDTNLHILEALREHQAEIEGALDAPLEWVVKPDVRAMRIAYETESGGFVDGGSLSEVADDVHDSFLRLEAAIQPFIESAAPELTDALGWQPRNEPWTEAEYLAAAAASCPDNEAPAQAILRRAHEDPRVSIEGRWGPQTVGIRLRTARSGDPPSEHSFINLRANDADNASAEVQFTSMMDRSRLAQLGNPTTVSSRARKESDQPASGRRERRSKTSASGAPHERHAGCRVAARSQLRAANGSGGRSSRRHSRAHPDGTAWTAWGRSRRTARSRRRRSRSTCRRCSAVHRCTRVRSGCAPVAPHRHRRWRRESSTVACHREGTTSLPHRWDHLGVHGAGLAEVIGVGRRDVNGGARAEPMRAHLRSDGGVSEVTAVAFRAL